MPTGDFAWGATAVLVACHAMFEACRSRLAAWSDPAACAFDDQSSKLFSTCQVDRPAPYPALF